MTQEQFEGFVRRLEGYAREHPASYALRVTLAKLRAARERRQRRELPEAPILCADTTGADITA